jgi:hypothetical protein
MIPGRYLRKVWNAAISNMLILGATSIICEIQTFFIGRITEFTTALPAKQVAFWVFYRSLPNRLKTTLSFPVTARPAMALFACMVLLGTVLVAAYSMRGGDQSRVQLDRPLWNAFRHGQISAV